MTLKQYALAIAGPRDAVINFAINGGIFWFALRDHAQFPLLEPPALLVMLIPMTILMPSLVTFFGFLNGFKHQRKLNQAAGRTEPIRWLKPAIVEGVLAAVIAMFAWSVIYGLLYVLRPDAHVPGKPAGVFIGVLAAVVAYILQARAVLRVGRL